MGEETKEPEKPAVILPTVGRMVYYKTRGSADGVFPPTHFAAIITEVKEIVGEPADGVIKDWNNLIVSLAVFGPQGLRFELNVYQGPEIGQWDWMPFQKDQQARLAK